MKKKMLQDVSVVLFKVICCKTNSFDVNLFQTNKQNVFIAFKRAFSWKLIHYSSYIIQVNKTIKVFTYNLEFLLTNCLSF